MPPAKRGVSKGAAKAKAKGKAKGRAKVKPTIKKPKAIGRAPASLFHPGKLDKRVVEQHTKMSLEKWKQLQEGMDEKWPVPAYMKGSKPTTPYKAETYRAVSLFHAGTHVDFRPHAKAPGRKSHLRYEKYSKAKTIGDAFKKGIYATDLLWDYERGYIRVVGGLREKPMDAVEAFSGDATKIDKLIRNLTCSTLQRLQTDKKRVLRRGSVDKGAIKRATKMNTEQWNRSQEGLDELWPVPEYMRGRRPESGRYQPETLKFVTRWTENTRIQYRPHAKAPGTKSHVRYEQYSKAKTVGESLALGTFPTDWCWDYERGYIKVTDGTELREAPESVQQIDRKDRTQVDKRMLTLAAKIPREEPQT